MPEETTSVAPSTSPTSIGSEGSGAAISAPDSNGSGNAVSAAQRTESGEPAQEEGKSRAKSPSAYYQIRQAKKAFKTEQEAFARQREAFLRERAEFEEAKKPKRDYSIAELQKYRKQWENEGQLDLVEAADKEIEVMRAEEKAKSSTVNFPVMGTPEHKAQWESAERELAATDPEFMRDGTRLDKRLREIMGSQDGNLYRLHPRGIVAAYHRAKMELLKADVQSLQTALQKKDQELKRYEGLTSIGGGAPGKIGSGSKVESLADFAKLSTAEMRKHLLGKKDKPEAVPWF